MIKDLEGFYAEAEPYMALFDAFAKKHDLVGQAQADHLCYKCGSRGTFEQLRTMFEKAGCWIYQSPITGRTIAYVGLKRPFRTMLGDIRYLELSDQKPDFTQRTKFDHVEVYPLHRTYEDMVAELGVSEKVVLEERPHHTTHSVDIGGFLFRCTVGPLVDKIKATEML
ncbi:MAG: VOC family protein [Patescibacteria group bacterium]